MKALASVRTARGGCANYADSRPPDCDRRRAALAPRLKHKVKCYTVRGVTQLRRAFPAKNIHATSPPRFCSRIAEIVEA